VRKPLDPETLMDRVHARLGYPPSIQSCYEDYPEIYDDPDTTPEYPAVDVSSSDTNRPTPGDTVETLVEEIIQAYSLACADWQTNSMRELMIEEQIAAWRERARLVGAGTRG
jgi:hypothetical protein